MWERAIDRQLTHDPYGHILTNIGCWSRDGQWIVYDTRSDPAGSRFDGTRIERVHTTDGRVERLYESRRGAHCGVVTCCPVTDRVIFILGPEHPTEQWSYAAWHRRGVFLRPGDTEVTPLDAMCYDEPFVPGALRGGSHVHTFDARGELVAFTYEDHVLAVAPPGSNAERNARQVGVSSPIRGVEVHTGHPRNHSGSHFSVLVTRSVDQPQPGSDDVLRAFEDAWVGHAGYRLPGSSVSQRALAFLGEVVTASGQRITELFVVDLPADLTAASEAGPLEGTRLLRPRPPRGTRQRRLTYTQDRPLPGLAPVRHWPRSTPDGSRIFFLMCDATGAAQFWSISPLGGQPQQLTHLTSGVTSAFSVSADGQWLAHTADGCVCATSIATGETFRLTEPCEPAIAPRGEACVFAPQGHRIAYIRPHQTFNQVHIVGQASGLSQ
ncbi:MAG: DUF3748 domain-containing protein [Aureliella sp.]